MAKVEEEVAEVVEVEEEVAEVEEEVAEEADNQQQPQRLPPILPM